STSGRALSIQRTRLTMASLEMCMCLKDHLDAQERKQDKSSLENPVDFEEEILDAEDHLDAQERKQDKSSLENPVDFEEEILDAEVQQNKAISLSDEEIALDTASSEGNMSGSCSGGEEVDYDMTNYGDDYLLSIIMLYFQFQSRYTCNSVKPNSPYGGLDHCTTLKREALGGRQHVSVIHQADQIPNLLEMVFNSDPPLKNIRPSINRYLPTLR
nr:zinc finger BED domain-containing protein RICESLEEPER 2 [Tanacetum cinerariifolium]